MTAWLILAWSNVIKIQKILRAFASVRPLAIRSRLIVPCRKIIKLAARRVIAVLARFVYFARQRAAAIIYRGLAEMIVTARAEELARPRRLILEPEVELAEIRAKGQLSRTSVLGLLGGLARRPERAATG